MGSWHIGFGALLRSVARQHGPRVGASWLTVVACDPPRPDNLDALRSGLASLRDRGEPIRLSSLVEPTADLPDRAVLVTFDGPQAEHVTAGLPLLRELGLSAVFFVPSDCILERRLPDADRIAHLVAHARRSSITLTYPLALTLDLGDRLATTRLLQRVAATRYGLDPNRFVEELAAACGVPWSPSLERELADERVLTVEDLKTLRDAGMDVASLGATGRPFHLSSPGAIEAELTRAREALSEALGSAVTACAAPLGHPQALPTAARLFASAGYEVAFTQRTGLTPLAGERDPLALRRIPLRDLEPRRAPPPARRTSSELTLELATDASDLAALADDWDALLAASAEPQVTRSAPWARAWWAVYGSSGGRQLRVVGLRRSGRLVGVVPLVLRPSWGSRRLELVGSGEDQRDETCSEYLGAVVAPGEEQAVAIALAEALASNELGGWDELHLVNLSPEDDLVPLLAEALAPLGEVSHFSHAACPYVALPGSWTDYLASKSSSRRQRLKRTLRRFERWTEGEHELRVVTTEPERRRAMRLLAQLHEERWAAGNECGAFASSLFRDFHDRVSRHLLAAGRLELTWLEVKGEPVASQYSFVSGDRLQFYQAGRSTSVPANIPIGMILHLLNMQRAIELSRGEYDFLAGITRYKMELADRLRPLYTLRVVRRSLRGRAIDAGRLSLDLLRAARNNRES